MNEIFGVEYNQLFYQTLNGVLNFSGCNVIEHDVIYNSFAEYIDNDICTVIVKSEHDYPDYGEYKTLCSDGNFTYSLPISVILRLVDPDMVREAFEYKREKINELEHELFGNVDVKSAKY